MPRDFEARIIVELAEAGAKLVTESGLWSSSKAVAHQSIKPLEHAGLAPVRSITDPVVRLPEGIPSTLADPERHVPSANKIGTLLHETTIDRIVQNQAVAARAWQPVDELKKVERQLSIGLSRESRSEGLAKYHMHPDFEQPDVMQPLLSHDPHAVAAYTKYDGVRTELIEVQAQLYRQAEERAKILEPAYASDLAAIEMPMAPFGATNYIWSNAGRDGVFVNQKLLLHLFGTQVTNFGTHEFTHWEQYYLRTCLEADRLGVNVRSNPSQLDTILARLKAGRTEMTEPTVLNFLKMRAGRQLLPGTAARVEMLEQSFYDLSTHPLTRTHTGIEFANIQRYQWQVSANQDLEASRSIVNQVYSADNGPRFAAELFGAEVGPAERQSIMAAIPLKNAKAWTSSDDQTARAVLDASLNRADKRMADISHRQQNLYLNSLHEQEARYNGAVLALQSLEKIQDR